MFAGVDRRFVQDTVQGRQQLGSADRLSHIGVHAGRQIMLAIFWPIVRRHGNDGKTLARWLFPFADGGRGLQAIHFGHLDIHQHGVEHSVLQCLQRFLTIADDRDRVAMKFQQPRHKLLIQRCPQQPGGSRTVETSSF